jgi:hypothetical protein
MEMYRDYFEEEYGRKTYVNEFGFCSYSIDGNELFIADFYVKPEFRKSYEAKKLFTEVADIGKMAGCEFLSANVHVMPIKAEKSTRLIRTYLAMGFRAFKSDNNHLTLVYDLKERSGSA